MQSAALRPPVPSRSLLRFLRSQTEAAFFDQNHTHGHGRRLAAPVPSCSGPREGHGSLKRRAGLFSVEPVRLGPCKRGGYARSLANVFSTSAVARKTAEAEEGGGSWSWQEKLWGRGARKGSKPLKPDDLPPRDEADNSSSMFNNRRILSSKAALDPRLRCTEVDENGRVILMDGEFKKTELIAKYGLLPRDLRKIDSSNLPHILIRPSAILLNLLHLRVLIRRDRVLLFDVYGSKTSYPQSAFMYDLQGKLQQKPAPGVPGLPYEFRALEAVLTSVTSELEADFEAVREPVMHVLGELEDDIDRQKLRQLLILSKRVSTFEQKAKLVRDAIEELLEADDDLAAMYLTEKAHDLYRNTDDHTEVEMLLESYGKITDEIVQEAGNLVSGIRNTEDIVRAILDANRNSLMLMELKFSIGALGIAVGTFIAGLYGANLENFIEETNWGFGVVTSASVAFSLAVCWYGLARLRRIQRIKMSGDERPHLPRGLNYCDEGIALGLMDARHRELMRRSQVHKALVVRNKWLSKWKITLTYGMSWKPKSKQASQKTARSLSSESLDPLADPGVEGGGKGEAPRWKTRSRDDEGSEDELAGPDPVGEIADIFSGMKIEEKLDEEEDQGKAKEKEAKTAKEEGGKAKRDKVEQANGRVREKEAKKKDKVEEAKEKKTKSRQGKGKT